MRELIYLSEAKLRQFRSERKTKWRHVREVDAKAPLNLGGIRFSFPDEARSTVADLERVLRYLELDSAQPPRWYTEDGLDPGQWVQFEARMNYQILQSESSSDSNVLVFWEIPGAEPVRLLLHGSPHHLLSATRAERPASYHTASMPQEFLESVRRVIVSWDADRRLSMNLVLSLMAAADLLPPEMASPVAGVARITGTVRTEDDARVVLASPLYVQYAR